MKFSCCCTSLDQLGFGRKAGVDCFHCSGKNHSENSGVAVQHLVYQFVFGHFSPNSWLLGISSLSSCVHLFWNAVSAFLGLSPSLSSVLSPILSALWGCPSACLVGLSPSLFPVLSSILSSTWDVLFASMSQLVSHLVSQLVWDAGSASLGLSPSLPFILSPGWFGMLCPPFVSGFISHLVSQLVRNAVCASWVLSPTLSPVLSPSSCAMLCPPLGPVYVVFSTWSVMLCPAPSGLFSSLFSVLFSVLSPGWCLLLVAHVVPHQTLAYGKGASQYATNPCHVCNFVSAATMIVWPSPM